MFLKDFPGLLGRLGSRQSCAWSVEGNLRLLAPTPIQMAVRPVMPASGFDVDRDLEAFHAQHCWHETIVTESSSFVITIEGD